MNQLLPKKILSDVVSVSLSDGYSSAITEDGSLYMWGYNGNGAIGNGSRTDQLLPQKILSDVVSVSLGYGHSSAITKDGSLYMWGRNTSGQIGNGSRTDQLLPQKILSDVVSVSLGYYHSSAITEDGSLYMWGYNYKGQVGNGSMTYQLLPQKILSNVVSVSLSDGYSGAITEDGSLYMWGNNENGQIGNGSTVNQLIPQKVLSDVVSVCLRRGCSGAITKDGSLYMWGYNGSGAIGNGSKTDQLIPQKILSDVVSVSMGYAYNGAITEDGSLYMWGSNYSGQIGNGSTVNQLIPQKVLSDVVSVCLGNGHSGAITEDGSLYMWGDNYLGQIGNGSTKDQLTPVKVLSLGSNTVNVHVTAIDKSTNESVPVEGAEVYLYVGTELKSTTLTDSEGNAKISLDGLTDEELQKATISAKKIVSQGKALDASDGDARADLFEHFPKDENGDYYRYTMELHSHSLNDDGTVDVETIDDAGNWVGAPIPEMDRFTLKRELNLELSEPRMLVNLAVCYFADDDTSQSGEYVQGVMTMLNEYSHRLAEATDAHIMIDKILLFSTDDRFDFYFKEGETPDIASMADIQIQAEVEDDGTWWNNVIIHQNAHVLGFFYDSFTDEASVDNDYMEQFKNLKDVESYLGHQYFPRIIFSGTEVNNGNMNDHPYWYAETMTHETGHYLMGFYDEYQRGTSDTEDGQGLTWDECGYRPYSPNFGLMEWEHGDIELSRNSVEYAYMNDDYENMTRSLHTEHSWIRQCSCEDFLAGWMTNQEYFNATNIDFSVGEYKSTYSKVEGTADHTATYWYAELDESDFLSVPLHETSSLSFDANSTEEMNEVLASSEAALTKDAVAQVSFTSNDDTVTVSLDEENGMAYTVSVRKSGEDSFRTVKLSNGIAELSIAKGELAEVRISDGDAYNCYYIDRSENTDVGYIYTSADNAVMAYVSNDTDNSYTFIADNTGYTNGEYISVNQAARIISDSGEIYSVASYMAEIDYTTLTWFKYADGVWTALAADYSNEENMNIGARADLDGAGIYVLMAKPASDTKALSAKNLKYTQSTDRDAVVTLTFDDPNTDSKYYNVYYSDTELTDKNADNVVVRSFDANSTELAVNLIERGRTVYAAVEIVLEDGSRSDLVKITLTGGEADSDGDGIPDWYCNQYLLWGNNGEEKDIAGSDDDGDGLTNLEEYLGGSDPKCKDEVIDDTSVIRIYGSTRYETSYAIADALKTQMGVGKFDTVILANGKNFPDALAGSYLASEKNAPILMASEKNIATLQTYIKENLKAGGTIYVLGGTGAVPESVLKGLSGYDIQRLAGANRYETNLLILEEAGVTNEDILVCTGKTFADSLSASATGKPILLVNNKELTSGQKEFLEEHTGNQYYIIGGEGAVSKSMESAIKKYGAAERISGASRYETSVKVAEEFFENPDAVVLAYAKNFPDGLCGGPLAMNKNVPLILTATGKTDAAAAYVSENDIKFGKVLGGASLISDAAVKKIF